jgi:UDP-N-acetylglucosamine:LPS N-acetylglucosamine transferase
VTTGGAHPPLEDALPEVLVFFIDAGGGHRAAAKALIAAAASKRASFRVEAVNLQQVLEPLDFWKALTGRPIEQAYNALIQKGSTRFMVPLLHVLQTVIRLRHRPLVRCLRDYLAARRRPAVVVSVMPNFNAVIRDALAASHPGVPFVVLLTDFADFGKRFWLVPGLDRVIVGSDQAAAQALAAGLPPERVSRTSGMILHPRFHPPPGSEAALRFRREAAIEPEAFVVLLLFGGKGAPEMERLAEELLSLRQDWHVIAICGDNPPLQGALEWRAPAHGGRLHVLGFSDRVAEALAASNLLVTKPGPASLAEAFHLRVPVVVTCNAATVPQERYNARYVGERGLGVVVREWSEVAPAAAALAAGTEELRAIGLRLEALPENRAVFEALTVIEAEVGRR